MLVKVLLSLLTWWCVCVHPSWKGNLQSWEVCVPPGRARWRNPALAMKPSAMGAALISDSESSEGSHGGGTMVDFDFCDAKRLPTRMGQCVTSLGSLVRRKQSYLARFLSKRCPCHNKCIECFLTDTVFQEDAFNSWCGLAQCPKDMQDMLLAQRFQAAQENQGRRRTCHSVVGRPVCRSALFWFLELGRGRHKRLLAGAPGMRHRTKTRAGETINSWQQSDVFSFLWGICNSVAEFCPNHDVPTIVGLTESTKADLNAATELLLLDPREVNAMQRALNSLDNLPRKFLPPRHVKQYYWQYCSVRLDAHQASYSKFKKVWRIYFRNLLGFTKFSAHPVCSVCSELKAHMREASGVEERVHWGKKFDEHQDDQMLDRQVYYKMREASRKGDLLCIMQDGNDQAKYRLVRTPRPPKDMADLWCPPRRLLGSLVHGWVGWGDMHRSGSDLTLEAIMTCIEETRRVANETGRRMPEHLWVQLDNTPAENKNRFVLQALAALVDRGIFTSATAAFLRVGHTHTRTWMVCGKSTRPCLAMRSHEIHQTTSLVSHTR
jgi:hypothetical protein